MERPDSMAGSLESVSREKLAGRVVSMRAFWSEGIAAQVEGEVFAALCAARREFLQDGGAASSIAADEENHEWFHVVTSAIPVFPP